ncbi:MAG: FAD:protein FMN transferase [Clostridiales bacterium]|nr:FAD:protein FMN transferase [Clostridiales bacterium]
MNINHFFVYMLIISILCFSTGCTSSVHYDQTYIYAMDTIISIKLAESKDNEIYFRVCEKIISDIENRFSRTLETSEVGLFNSSDEGFASASNEFVELITQALTLSDKTNGAFDITIAPLVSLWDITAENPSLPEEAAIKKVLSFVGAHQIEIFDSGVKKSSPMVQIDLGGIAKGYALGKIVSYLNEQKVPYGTVSFGGNVGVVGQKPDQSAWKIGIKDPLHTEDQVGFVTIESGYIAVSGDYERYFEMDGKRYHHIIDPFTGYPANTGLHSVAVIAEDPVWADALSTALFVMGPVQAMQFYESTQIPFEAVFISDDGIVCTAGIKDNFSPKKG